MTMRHAITAAILLGFSLLSIAVLASLLQQLATRH
jgi:cbb3-type cytochrome oxidase subunit 3